MDQYFALAALVLVLTFVAAIAYGVPATDRVAVLGSLAAVLGATGTIIAAIAR